MGATPHGAWLVPRELIHAKPKDLDFGKGEGKGGGGEVGSDRGKNGLRLPKGVTQAYLCGSKGELCPCSFYLPQGTCGVRSFAYLCCDQTMLSHHATSYVCQRREPLPPCQSYVRFERGRGMTGR